MRPSDMLMRIGKSHYSSAGMYIQEVMTDGASKRLPAPPTGAVQDVTKVFLVHPHAIVLVKRGMRVNDLVQELHELAETNEQVKKAMWTSPWHRKDDLVAQVYAIRDAQARVVFKRYGVRFRAGIIGYFYVAQFQGIVDSEDADLDQVLKDAGVVPVFVVREGDDGL